MRSRLRNDYDYCRNQASLYIQVVSLRSPQSLRNETFFLWHPGGRKSLYNVTLDPPGHRADEASRRRRVCRTDFQDLSHQCRIVWNPVSHHDAPAGPRHRTISLATSKGLGANICAKDGYDEIEAAIYEIVQIGGIAFLKLAVGQALGNGALPAGRDEIACYVDAQHLGAERASGKAVVPSPHPRSSALSPFVIPSVLTRASPLSLIDAAMRVKSPFSQSALFGFIASPRFPHQES